MSDEPLYRLKTFDFVCDACGVTQEGVLLRIAIGDDPPDTTPCDCGAAARRIATFGSTMKVALPDGNRRLDPIRRQRVLQKAERKAKRTGDKDTLVKIANERTKLKGST